MQIEKTIANLEVTEDDAVIVRERHAVMDGDEEKSHWYEQRTIRAGDDYSGDCEKVRKVCEALFSYKDSE